MIYGFDEEKEKNAINQINEIEMTDQKINGNIISGGNDIKITNLALNKSEIKEKEIKNVINKKIKNKGRNFFSVVEGVSQTSEVALQIGEVATQFAITGSIQALSLALLSVTSIVFGAYSCYNIHEDCHKILDIYDKAFTPLKFDTLKAYIKCFRKVIAYLEEISQKFSEDDKEENKIERK